MKFTDIDYAVLQKVNGAIDYPYTYFPKFRELSRDIEDLKSRSKNDTELNKKFDAPLDHLGLEIEKVDYVVRKKKEEKQN